MRIAKKLWKPEEPHNYPTLVHSVEPFLTVQHVTAMLAKVTRKYGKTEDIIRVELLLSNHTLILSCPFQLTALYVHVIPCIFFPILLPPILC